MIRSSAEWAYRQYAQDKASYEFENQARKKKAGLWALSKAERILLWEWRKAKLNGKMINKISGKALIATVKQNAVKCLL